MGSAEKSPAGLETVRFDERFRAGYSRPMSSRLIHAVQRSYPKIYLACHVDHVRTRSNPHHLSAHDSSLLAHLDESTGILPGQLARHLGVANSTLSPALKRLEALGYVSRLSRKSDRRRHELRLTPLGVKAMSASSVLDPRRLARVLALMAPANRRAAVAGLELLAQAALRFQAVARRRNRW
jgi:DNA-binding MarR family transcriptional regulator